jgi:hypothetical protein
LEWLGSVMSVSKKIFFDGCAFSLCPGGALFETLTLKKAFAGIIM